MRGFMSAFSLANEGATGAGLADGRTVALGAFRQAVAGKTNDSRGRFVIAGRSDPVTRASFSTLPRIPEESAGVG
jgi:hypothetical protein